MAETEYVERYWPEVRDPKWFSLLLYVIGVTMQNANMITVMAILVMSIISVENISFLIYKWEFRIWNVSGWGEPVAALQMEGPLISHWLYLPQIDVQSGSGAVQDVSCIMIGVPWKFVDVLKATHIPM